MLAEEASQDQMGKDEPIIFDDEADREGPPNVGMIRMDLSQSQIPQTPKNEILLMRLTDQLLAYLEQA